MPKHNTNKPCPICYRPVEQGADSWWPFCSERCRTQDLGHWAMGAYRIAGRPEDSEGLGEEKKEGNESGRDA